MWLSIPFDPSVPGHTILPPIAGTLPLTTPAGRTSLCRHAPTAANSHPFGLTAAVPYPGTGSSSVPRDPEPLVGTGTRCASPAGVPNEGRSILPALRPKGKRGGDDEPLAISPKTGPPSPPISGSPLGAAHRWRFSPPAQGPCRRSRCPRRRRHPVGQQIIGPSDDRSPQHSPAAKSSALRVARKLLLLTTTSIIDFLSYTRVALPLHWSLAPRYWATAMPTRTTGNMPLRARSGVGVGARPMPQRKVGA